MSTRPNLGERTNNLTKPIVVRFCIALLLLTGVAIGAAALVYMHFRETELLAGAVEESGRQRGLIVRASDLVRELTLSTDESVQAVLRASLLSTARELATDQAQLMRPHELTLLLPETTDGPGVGSEIQTFVAAIFAIAKAPPDNRPGSADYQTVIGIGARVLETLERNQARWESESVDTGRRLLVMEWIAIAGSIVILWGMTMFVFVPLLRRVRKHVAELEELNTSLETRVAERSTVLQEREARFQAVYEQAAVGLALCDPEGRYFDANETFCRLLGYTVAELKEKTYRDITYAEDVELDAFQKDMLTEGAAKTAIHEKRYLRKDGTPVWVNRSISVVRNTSGEADYIIVVVRDISEQKRAEQELRVARDQAEAASQSKSDFLANVSHELRTPLNAIIGFSQIIEGQILGPVGVPRYAEYARNILDAGHHLLEIINEILDMSRIEAGAATLRESEIDVPRVVESVLRLMGERASAAQLRMVNCVHGNLPPLWADERYLRQVLLNLVSNALKFTPAGGSITVAGGIAENGDLEISVRDTGVGIAEEDIGRVFRPFAQAENSMTRRYEGVGLGLPIAKSLMELHGGHLSLTSAAGVGTVVTATFPAQRVRPAKQSGASDDALSADRKRA